MAQETDFVLSGSGLLNIFLQPTEPLLGQLKDIIILANRESQPILRKVRIGICKELRWRDSGHAQLADQEPRELEITRPTGHMRREVVVFRQLHFREIGENEVAAFRIGVRQTELVPYLVERVHLCFHFLLAILPEIVRLRLFEGYGCCFL